MSLLSNPSTIWSDYIFKRTLEVIVIVYIPNHFRRLQYVKLAPGGRGHTVYDDFGVMDLVWHPAQPWLLTAGADSYINLWT